jgi:TIR domain
MADIFVSYAKTDRLLASKLVAMLEAEGWTVWWDTSLGVADLYRDEIMKQLAAARAAISIWTPNSIRSDWVRAEAGRAKADGSWLARAPFGLACWPTLIYYRDLRILAFIAVPVVVFAVCLVGGLTSLEVQRPTCLAPSLRSPK